MNISFVVNPIEGGWSPWDKRVGGSEEAVVEWSKRLKGRGHEVTVYHNGRHGENAGVLYRERSDYLKRQAGVTVNVNYPDFKPLEPTLYWTTLDTQGGRDLSAFEEVLCISEYARDHTGLDHRLLSILPPGYDSQCIKPGKKIPRTVLYASSPDRGLKDLLRVWPDVVEIHRDAYLIVTYGATLDDVPNAICLGEVSEQEMNELYATSDIWCHPANGGELYCMAGVKAQVAQCFPICYPTMALKETVKFGMFSSPESLAEDLVTALTKHPVAPRLEFPDWDSTTDLLEAKLKRYT